MIKKKSRKTFFSIQLESSLNDSMETKSTHSLHIKLHP